MVNLKIEKQVFNVFWGFVVFALAIGIQACSDSDSDGPSEALAPKNLQVTSEIQGADASNPNGDGSGKISFKASAENATSYKISYDGTQYNMPQGNYDLTVEEPGVNSYDFEVTASNASSSIKKSVTASVLRLFEIPEALLEILTGGSSKEWRIKNESAGHMGVGPEDSSSPDWWIAQPYDKDYTAMYDDRYTFNTEMKLGHETGSFVYGKASPLTDDFGAIAEEPNADDEYEAYPLETYESDWTYSEVNGRGRLNFNNNGFLGFYVGGDHSYEILRRSDTELSLKTVGDDSNGWFFILTTEAEKEIPEDPEYTNMIFNDEFDTPGAPNDAYWNYDIGTGENGWGNQEAQYYTNRAENVVVEDGLLKITAKREEFNGAGFTSARLKTQGKFDFTYGKVEVRAKLPEGGGTWPAIWMLGSNITSVGWPDCGEIDIMEHTGNNPGSIQSAIHNRSSFGNTVNKKSRGIEDESDTFHTYAMVWSEEQISFYLDGERFYTYRPDNRNPNNWPFDAAQFMILNVAMGGTLGGDISAGFMESKMEIDYVRVYQ